ncbi:hypothetical protein [Effusibacillus dendaii]|uniref:Uncharacterized protein n=1 Tax=Effusibacillus dendaii TaxID=2743772 RepID=A0A7I8DGK2_9BACL|nr:hypothetical protein [Effusibacillus dendaii]BCJ86931.1 hypothetical protein skT53_19160 [Effusibacillus dendaii]
MTRTQVKTHRFRIGKKTFIIVKITQMATAKVKRGNALASNAANVQIVKKRKRH